MNSTLVVSFTESGKWTMRSHKVYSRSTLPGLQPSQQQHDRHGHHHQRHPVTSSRRKTSSPELLRASSQPMSTSSSLAARRRSSPGKSSLKMKSIGRSRPLPPLEPLKAGHRIDPQERIFLEATEHGDKHTVQRCLQGPQPVNVNCTNILGRSAIQVMSNTCCISCINHLHLTRFIFVTWRNEKVCMPSFGMDLVLATILEAASVVYPIS